VIVTIITRNYDCVVS